MHPIWERHVGRKGGLNLAVGGGQQVLVVGHEAASAWLSNPQMAQQQAREITALYAGHGLLGHCQLLSFASGHAPRIGTDSCVYQHCNDVDVLNQIAAQVHMVWHNQSLERQVEVWARSRLRFGRDG